MVTNSTELSGIATFISFVTLNTWVDLLFFKIIRFKIGHESYFFELKRNTVKQMCLLSSRFF
jgi:hypothetical protein